LSGTGEKQIIEITAERFGHGQLVDADCKISLRGGDYESVQKVDMSTRSILTPKPKFDRPLEIKDGDEITIKIECLFPWDIDSDPGDNEIRKILTGGDVGEEEFDTLESIMTAIIVILISASLAWIRKSRREMREFEEMAKQKIQERIETEESKQIGKRPDINDSNEGVEQSIQNEEYIGIEEAPEVENEIENEEEGEELDEFERRLRRIRRNN